MSNELKTIKFKPILGALPEMGATDWWTEEDWREYYAYVEELKKEGKYLTEGEELTIHYKLNPLFDTPNEPKEQFENFGLLIPKGHGDENIKIPYEPNKLKL